MTTQIVVATRSGLAQAPDGGKFRLVRGRTLADVRHPLAAAHPELFAPYDIELPYEGDEALGESAGDLLDVGSWPEKVAEVEQVADGYRAQLAAIAEGLHERGLVPADLDTAAEGWLATLVFSIIDASPAEVAEPEGKLPEPAASPLPKPRKRAARPRATSDASE